MCLRKWIPITHPKSTAISKLVETIYLEETGIHSGLAMDALPNHHFQAAADSPSGIVFRPDIFDISNATVEMKKPSRSSSMNQKEHQERTDTQDSDAANKPRETERRKRDQHVTFQDPQIKQRLSSIHPAFRQRPSSGRAGDIAAIDDHIARNGGTTSTYEQLPHRLRISKQQRPVSPAERVVELSRTNGYLMQELAYHKDIQEADRIFYITMTELYAKLGVALKERSQKRVDAESTLLSYWGIDFGDGNIEETIF